MNYTAQYKNINFSAIPKEIADEFKGIYENTDGFTRHMDLESQNFKDLYDLIESMPGAIKKSRTGNAKKVINKAAKLRSLKSKRTESSKKLSLKRRDLVTPKEATPAVQGKAPKNTQATSKKKLSSGKRKAEVTPKEALLAKESKKDLALKKKVEDLKVLVNANRDLVKQNAQFKDKISAELRKYLKDNRVINGMSGLADEYAKLKVQDRFYSNLLRGDSADFLIIAKRLGIVSRKGSIKVSEKTKKAVGMSGKVKVKAKKSKSKITKSKSKK